MNIKRFFAATSREALKLVRQDLGADAVILSSREVDGGSEILAFTEEDMASMIATESSPVRSQPSKKAGTLDGSQAQALANMLNRRTEPAAAKPASAAKDSPASTGQAEMAAMMTEIRAMRSMIESQLTELTWANIQQREPAKSAVLGNLLAAGFSAQLSRQLAENLPAGHTSESAMTWVQTVLENNLQVIPNESELLDQGGVFALVGPTGVGKTTTTAKLAARYVMKHGTNKLALITTDGYRIGGHEQLRIYGKILGVMVHAVKDEADLKLALQELKGKHTILIDTVGVSQRDRMVTEQILMLSNAGSKIKKLLCLNATSTGETLMDVVNAYKGRGIDGCIITKMDEAVNLGGALDVILREKLRLFYVANGQRVPEDLHLPNKRQLLHYAFRSSQQKSSLSQFNPDELPFLMANSGRLPAAQGLEALQHA